MREASACVIWLLPLSWLDMLMLSVMFCECGDVVDVVVLDEKKKRRCFQEPRPIYTFFEAFSLPPSLAVFTASYLHALQLFRVISPRVTSKQALYLEYCASKLHVQCLIRVMVFDEAIDMQHIHLRVSAAAVQPSCRVALHMAMLAIGSTQHDSLRIDMELHFNDEL